MKEVYAVISEYSWLDDIDVKVFDSLAKAKRFVSDIIEEEKKEDYQNRFQFDSNRENNEFILTWLPEDIKVIRIKPCVIE